MSGGQGLWRWSLFAAMLSFAGLPIYIHAPKFYVDEYGVGLAAMGVALGLLRLVDVVQDPALGWLAERWRRARGGLVLAGGLAMAAAMLALFAVPAPVAPVVWFALSLLVLFSGFSLLTICFYAEGVDRAGALGGQGHVRLATWREGGALLGVSLAAVAPVALLALSDRPFAAFAAVFALIVVASLVAMRRQWRGQAAPQAADWRAVLADPVARRLLLLAMVNGAPVAVTSTLFLYFVESRLMAPGTEGPFLLLFFLSAAASAAPWGRLAQAHGPKPVLLAGMVLSVVTFGFAMTLGAGDTWAFAAICVASGAALGADMVLLPAIFARHLSGRAGGEALAFGLWNFAAKLTLALAAVTLLPLLEAAGFTPSAANPASVLLLLTALYAALPCALKLIAIALLISTPVPKA
jgi:GPH family glycoside/pentoside/hexuronide:cation symporter